jgi:hypothetical protein
MPHIISHSYNNSAHPLFPKGARGKTSGMRETSTEKTKDKVPRSYESIKEAAGAKEQVQLPKKNNHLF